MLPAIGRLVSEAFYPDLKLLSGRSEPVIDPALMPESLGAPLVWIETDSLGEIAFEEKEKDGSSRSNRIEADAIVSLLDQWHAHEPFKAWLLAEKKQRAGIGVICMYAAQRDLIRRKLMQSPLSYLLDGYVKLGTVDSYQGKENPIIVLSLVRNNDQGPNEFGVRRIKEGFLSAPNRINVSASRAMDRLVIVGARNRWRQNSAVGRLAAGFSDLLAEEGQAVVIDASSVVAPADEARASRRGSSKAKSSKAGNVNG
jgi:superfamily I DNA and/or RNA helicase